MKLSLKLLDSSPEITKAILEALLPDVTDHMNKASTFLQKNIPEIISKAIVSTPEYESLTSGILRLELGIPDAQNKVHQLIEYWISNMQVSYSTPKITSGTIKSKLSISMVKADFSDVLNKDFAEVVHNIDNYSLPWLRWLVLEGTMPLVKDHEVIIGPNARSRTGGAIMKNKTGASWSVPSPFAGTQDDNWITRAINSASQDIDNLLSKALL